MSRKCVVHLCKLFDGECSIFSVPETSFEIWMDVISEINGFNTKVKFVCEKHFQPQDILRNYANVNGEEVNLLHFCFVLFKTSFDCLLQNLPLTQRLKVGLGKGSFQQFLLQKIKLMS